MNTPVVFGLLAIAALTFYGGQMLRRRRRGRIAWLDAHPRVAAVVAIAAILMLLALGVGALTAIFVQTG